MKFKRQTKLLVEPPAVATGDIAFNLIVFFLVCASSAPQDGRKQSIPKSDSKTDQQQQSKNIEVSLTRNTVSINGNPYNERNFTGALRSQLSTRTRTEDKIVVVKSSKDTPYEVWIRVTGYIEEAGGVITIQREEERTIVAD
jgi:biopolymer transport protein ExbD